MNIFECQSVRMRWQIFIVTFWRACTDGVPGTNQFKCVGIVKVSEKITKKSLEQIN